MTRPFACEALAPQDYFALTREALLAAPQEDRYRVFWTRLPDIAARIHVVVPPRNHFWILSRGWQPHGLPHSPAHHQWLDSLTKTAGAAQTWKAAFRAVGVNPQFICPALFPLDALGPRGEVRIGRRNLDLWSIHAIPLLTPDHEGAAETALARLNDYAQSLGSFFLWPLADYRGTRPREYLVPAQQETAFEKSGDGADSDMEHGLQLCLERALARTASGTGEAAQHAAVDRLATTVSPADAQGYLTPCFLLTGRETPTIRPAPPRTASGYPQIVEDIRAALEQLKLSGPANSVTNDLVRLLKLPPESVQQMTAHPDEFYADMTEALSCVQPTEAPDNTLARRQLALLQQWEWPLEPQAVQRLAAQAEARPEMHTEAPELAIYLDTLRQRYPILFEDFDLAS